MYSSSQEFLVLSWLCHDARVKPRAMQIGTHKHESTELLPFESVSQ